ncbi:MAG: hypothetical protein EP297_11790 [Gammaproteobacteria bacterium]|nr:MAG: hypothetical protein EP297_11790 [Gammaproteobacteria bacterium]
MLPDALSQANKKFTRQRFLTILLAAVTITAGVLVLAVIKYLEPSGVEPADTPVEVQTSISPDETEELRSQFKQDLKYFESEVEPQLALANLAEWNKQAANDIPLLKNQALSAFAREDYPNALDALMQAKSLAEATLIDWKERFSTAYSKALSFFDEGSADMAMLNINEALILKPSDPDALTLKMRIDVLPEVIKLLLAADIARTENDMRKELMVLEKIVALDSARVGLNERITGLEQKLAENEFASYIEEGFKAVDDLDLRKANSSLAGAKAIFPARRETHLLSNKIAKTASTLSLANAKTKGKTAIAKDNWPLALTIFQKALKSHPDNGELISQIEKAKKIIALNDAVTDYLGRHHRLSSPNVASSANKILQETKNFSHMSKSLARKADELAEVLNQYNIPVDLIITSDNKTHISIRGIGNVGAVKKKLVRLRPGKYTIEGKRAGFRSKLLNVVINIGQNTAEVEVICDERI